MTIKLMLLVSIVDTTASQLLDLNAILNVAMLVVAAMIAVPLLKARRKDATIKDLEVALAAKEIRLQEREADLAGATARANQIEEAARHLRIELTAASARYDEQQKYTAKGAVTHMEAMLAEHIEQVAARHEKMLTALTLLVDRLDGGPNT